MHMHMCMHMLCSWMYAPMHGPSGPAQAARLDDAGARSDGLAAKRADALYAQRAAEVVDCHLPRGRGAVAGAGGQW